MPPVLVAFLCLLLAALFAAPVAQAQASCPSKLEIAHADGTKTCLTDSPLALVKPDTWPIPLATAIPASARYSVALTADPARCPAALGFAANNTTSFLNMGAESERRDAVALSECRRLVRAARPKSGADCGCDLVVSGGKSTLAAKAFEERATATAVRLLGMGTVTTDVAAATQHVPAPPQTPGAPTAAPGVSLAAAPPTAPVRPPAGPAAAPATDERPKTTVAQATTSAGASSRPGPPAPVPGPAGREPGRTPELLAAAPGAAARPRPASPTDVPGAEARVPAAEVATATRPGSPQGAPAASPVRPTQPPPASTAGPSGGGPVSTTVAQATLPGASVPRETPPPVSERPPQVVAAATPSPLPAIQRPSVTTGAEPSPRTAPGATSAQAAQVAGGPKPLAAAQAAPAPVGGVPAAEAMQVVSKSGTAAVMVSAAELGAIRQQLEALKAELARASEAVSASRSAAVARKSVSPRQKVRALVIGNGNYRGLTVLPNAPADAKALAAKFRALGIEVDLVLDATREQMVASLAKYEQRSAQYDVNIFFYAGHGIQVAGSNYLAPIDLSTETMSVGSVKLNSVALGDVLEYMTAKTRLVFLDACRNNPISRSLMATRTVSALGLAPVSVATGTLISYATRDGSVAEDGNGTNSPYTTALLKHLDAEEDIAVVLRRVRQAVLAATGNRQEPWEYGSLVGDELVLSQIAAAR